jgi:hypothetical protein
MVREGNIYEFMVITSFAKNAKDKTTGEEILKIVKPEVIYRFNCYLEDITAISESFNKNGGIQKDKCFINHKEYKELLVLGSYNKISNIIFPEEEETKIGYGSSK